MTDALHCQLFIDGTWTEGESNSVVDVLNPATESVIGTVTQATGKDVVRAIEAARRAFDEGPWPRMTPKERGGGSLSPRGPFGGYNQSGLGREWGSFGLDGFMEAKTVHWPVSGG